MTAKTLLMALGVGMVVGLILGIGLVGLIGANREQAAPTTPPPPTVNGATPDTVFVHYATPENTSANSTCLHGPPTDGNPNAVLVVTHNWNPGGSPGKYNDHPIGGWYDRDRGKWAIFNQDRAAMPVGGRLQRGRLERTKAGKVAINRNRRRASARSLARNRTPTGTALGFAPDGLCPKRVKALPSPKPRTIQCGIGVSARSEASRAVLESKLRSDGPTASTIPL